MSRDRYDRDDEPSYRYHCGGARSYDGPCGASDCGNCRNGAPPWDEYVDGEEHDDEDTDTSHGDTENHSTITTHTGA